MQTSRWQGVRSFLLALLLNGPRMYFFYSPSEYERTLLLPLLCCDNHPQRDTRNDMEPPSTPLVVSWSSSSVCPKVAVDVHIITISLFAYGGLNPLLVTGSLVLLVPSSFFWWPTMRVHPFPCTGMLLSNNQRPLVFLHLLLLLGA